MEFNSPPPPVRIRCASSTQSVKQFSIHVQNLHTEIHYRVLHQQANRIQSDRYCSGTVTTYLLSDPMSTATPASSSTTTRAQKPLLMGTIKPDLRRSTRNNASHVDDRCPRRPAEPPPGLTGRVSITSRGFQQSYFDRTVSTIRQHTGPGSNSIIPG